MTREEFRAAREKLFLSADGMARAMRLRPTGERTIRRWESGESPVSDTMGLLVELLLEKAAREEAKP